MSRCLAFVACLAVCATLVHAAEIIFPNDPRAVIDVKRDCGAKGDGIADDTAALQAAIERVVATDHTRFIYLPNGTYKITKTLVFRGPEWQGRVEGNGIGPWCFGQDRDKTIIKLADGAQGFGDPAKPLEAIRALSRPDGARMNADFFDRMVVNLTIDTGNNPGATGIKFYSNNIGEMRDVLIRGNGAVGLDMGFCDQNGPLLIQDIEIDGFATGISTASALNSQTISRVTVRNASKVGLLHRGQVFIAEALHVIGAPLAVDSSANGMLTLVDCTFEGPAGATGPAIKLDKSHLYAARITTTGFATAIAAPDAPAGDVAGPKVTEYSSDGVRTLGDAAPKAGLMMKPVREPVVPMPTRAEDWVCANDFGAKAGDEGDDADAFQQAIDAAAARGASTVYLLGGHTGDPNWYQMKKNVRVHGSVQRIIGLGFARVIGSSPADAQDYPECMFRFIVDDEPNTPRTVIFENMHVFSTLPLFAIEARSPQRTVICHNTDGVILARPNTTVFATNCTGHLYQEKGSTVWARQWNTEGGQQVIKINTRNDGGQLWILGLKTENVWTKVASLNGGRTEVLGVHNYNYSGVKDEVPFAHVENASMSIAGYRESCYNRQFYKIPVTSVVDGKESSLPQEGGQAWTLLRAGK